MTAARLRRLVTALPALGDDGEWLGQAVADYLDGSAPTLDQAVGLAGERGKPNWRNREARDRRDHHLREAARLHLQGWGISRQADDLSLELQRFVETTWARERHHEECPARFRGLIQEHLWNTMKAWPTVLSGRQIINILSLK